MKLGESTQVLTGEGELTRVDRGWGDARNPVWVLVGNRFSYGKGVTGLLDALFAA